METYLINGLLFLILGICFYTDITQRKIYNKVILAGVLPGMLLVGIFYGFSGILDGLAGLFLGISLLFIPFVMGGMGAGDVKLLGLVGALRGSEFVLRAFLFSAILGGLLAILILLRERQFLKTVTDILTALKISLLSRFTVNAFSDLKNSPKKLRMPYGPIIFLGSILCFIVS